MISLFEKRYASKKWILYACIAGVLLGGCSNKNLIKPGDTISVAYRKSLQLYRSKNYEDAAKAFETVISSGRGTDYARSAHYFVAESYYGSHQYLLAADAYDRFISLYPQSPKHENAAYKEALCYYKLSPRFEIDQKYTNMAIQKFQIYISSYPKSKNADTAGNYISEMRSKLAHKKFNAAQLYLRLDEYKSAIVYYDLTADQYPGSSWAEHALVREIAAYNEYASKSIESSKRKRYAEAVKTYEKYLQLFPDGANRPQAEASVDNARAALANLGPAPSKQKKLSVDQ